MLDDTHRSAVVFLPNSRQSRSVTMVPLTIDPADLALVHSQETKVPTRRSPTSAPRLHTPETAISQAAKRVSVKPKRGSIHLPPLSRVLLARTSAPRTIVTRWAPQIRIEISSQWIASTKTTLVPRTSHKIGRGKAQSELFREKCWHRGCILLTSNPTYRVPVSAANMRGDGTSH